MFVKGEQIDYNACNLYIYIYYVFVIFTSTLDTKRNRHTIIIVLYNI
jgi:hypothetical protein